MSEQKKIIGATLSGLLAIGALTLATSAQAVPDQPKKWEKCAGVAKAGQNDCAALDGSHGCSAQAKLDNADTEWVYVPKGTCTKITGGMVKAEKPAKA
jgi:uncharacterized membrane protein